MTISHFLRSKWRLPVGTELSEAAGSQATGRTDRRPFAEAVYHRFKPPPSRNFRLERDLPKHADEVAANRFAIGVFKNNSAPA